MKILLMCEGMSYLSGSPVYYLTLGRELAKEHEVYLFSRWGKNVRQIAIEYNIKPVDNLFPLNTLTERFDLALISQKPFFMPNANKVINIVHSEYDCETPTDRLDHYIAIRPEIKEHLIEEHNIPAEKIKVIYNGVDLEKFKPIQKTERDYIKVVIPATRDTLRQKLFDYYAERASKDFRIYIYGSNFGAIINDSEYISLNEPTFHIEEHIGDADIVAGILLGRVNLEARAMNVMSRIHNPEHPEEYQEFYPDWKEFVERHDIKNVAKQILNDFYKHN